MHLSSTSYLLFVRPTYLPRTVIQQFGEHRKLSSHPLAVPFCCFFLMSLPILKAKSSVYRLT